MKKEYGISLFGIYLFIALLAFLLGTVCIGYLYLYLTDDEEIHYYIPVQPEKVYRVINLPEAEHDELLAVSLTYPPF